MGPGRPKGPQTSQNLLVLSSVTVFHPYQRNLCKMHMHPYYVIISYIIIRSSLALMCTSFAIAKAYIHKGLALPKIINFNYNMLLSSIGCPSCNASLRCNWPGVSNAPVSTGTGPNNFCSFVLPPLVPCTISFGAASCSLVQVSSLQYRCPLLCSLFC